jgi:hypothetical protein
VVLALTADSDTRRARAVPAPRFHGPRQGDHTGFLTLNAATFAERQAKRAFPNCTPEQPAEKGPVPHWECWYHGQDTDRALPVPGSGRYLGCGP